MANEKIVKQWFTYAARDLKAAKMTIGFSNEFKNEAAFHAQQCIEKAMKGFLVANGIRPPKTHDLVALEGLLAPLFPNVSKHLKNAKAITDYAVLYRYPDARPRILSPLHFMSANHVL